jgi:hypothetical protein
VNKNGTLADFSAQHIGADYKFIQANTAINFMFDGTYLVVLGNPVVLSSTDYTIYADGKIGDDIIGTWKAFENDIAPYGWFESGTTFDANEYPELNTYLGGNTVPQRFDHNRLSTWEQSTITTADTTMQYDGIFMATASVTNSPFFVYVNNVRFTVVDTNSGTIYTSLNVPFKKGDKVRYSGTDSNDSKLAYYTHPLFIKAK